MTPRRLTDSEREIRESRGVSVSRSLPFIVMFIVLCIVATDQGTFERCLGHAPNDYPRGKAALVLVLVAVPCSPYYVDGSTTHLLIAAIFLGAALLALPQIFWFNRHKAYWDRVRAREKELRAEKRAKKLAAKRAAPASTQTPR